MTRIREDFYWKISASIVRDFRSSRRIGHHELPTRSLILMDFGFNCSPQGKGTPPDKNDAGSSCKDATDGCSLNA